jgi:hypothetical protein
MFFKILLNVDDALYTNHNMRDILFVCCVMSDLKYPFVATRNGYRNKQIVIFDTECLVVRLQSSRSSVTLC